MAWESLTFNDGNILYANSHMNPLQNNFTALAQQDSGAPAINSLARAWVNFDGFDVSSIRGSGNVSSITDDNTGQYTVNFTNALSNYAALATAGSALDTARIASVRNFTTSGVRINVLNAGDVAVDAQLVNVAIFN